MKGVGGLFNRSFGRKERRAETELKPQGSYRPQVAGGGSAGPWAHPPHLREALCHLLVRAGATDLGPRLELWGKPAPGKTLRMMGLFSMMVMKTKIQ